MRYDTETIFSLCFSILTTTVIYNVNNFLMTVSLLCKNRAYTRLVGYSMATAD